MDYKITTPDFEKKMLVDFIRAQEQEHQTFNLNKVRYEAMLASGLPEGALRTKIERDLPVIEERIAEVEAILASTYAQITDEEIAAVIAEEAQY